jgi:hypothetical protein
VLLEPASGTTETRCSVMTRAPFFRTVIYERFQHIATGSFVGTASRCHRMLALSSSTGIRDSLGSAVTTAWRNSDVPGRERQSWMLFARKYLRRSRVDTLCQQTERLQNSSRPGKLGAKVAGTAVFWLGIGHLPPTGR